MLYFLYFCADLNRKFYIIDLHSFSFQQLDQTKGMLLKHIQLSYYQDFKQKAIEVAKEVNLELPIAFSIPKNYISLFQAKQFPKRLDLAFFKLPLKRNQLNQTSKKKKLGKSV